MDIEFTLHFLALPDEPTDLSNVILDERHKAYIIYLVVSGAETAVTLATKYNLKGPTIRAWVSRYKTGRIISTGRGRPRVIDRYGMEQAQELTRTEVINAGLAETDLSDIATQEFVNTCQRRWPEIVNQHISEEQLVATFSISSKRRYRKKLQEFVEANYGFVDEMIV